MPRIYLSPPHMGDEERQLLLEAFDSNWIAPLGPQVNAFETEFCEYVSVPSSAALSSGTAALHLALILLGVGQGDAVLVSDLTFAASANAVRYVGAEPVFVDSDLATWTIDPERVGEALAEMKRKGRLPKALISVDLYGQCADYERLAGICNTYDVPIIQDACEALGAYYRGQPGGKQGILGVFSFNGNKIISTGGGGMLVSARPEWIDRARFLASQAREPVAHYEHKEVGFNYRMNNLLAALGRAQLRALPERVKQRRAIFERYVQGLGDLAGLTFMPEAPYGLSTRWLTCATIEPRGDVTPEMAISALAHCDIEARPVWKPMHLQPLYQGCTCFGGAVSSYLFKTGICLPSGSSLKRTEQERIIEIVRAAFAERGTV